MIQRQRPERQLNVVPQLVFLTLTFMAAVSGAYLALQLFTAQNEGSQVPQIITVEVIITATPLPTKYATAAPDGAQRAQVDLPADIAAEARDGQTGAIDPNALGARDVAISTPTVSIAGGPVINSACEFYTVLAGDSAYFIALRKNVELDELLRVNGMTVDSAPNLQIGQRLLIPHPGCRINQSTGEPIPVALADTATPAAAATSTPVTAQFEIVAAEGLGDITAEAIRLQNNGDTINISDWTLSGSSGNTFTFYNMLLFPQTSFVLYTRSGTATADARFWDRQESVWEPGEDLTIRDAQGRVLQRLTLPLPETDA
ncbi:MAG: lamin tail domain-containing protein [Chloroflexi bacterium]|nr:lamin tail domain-containing protein [Chloroflexota bacterium]